MSRILLDIYHRLYGRFGSQDWWPAETPFEVIVGAILTQNTAWSNVEKAIGNLKRERLLSPPALTHARLTTIARLIRPSGYYNIKARRLRNFLAFFTKHFKADMKKFVRAEGEGLRKALLEVNGIGPETADSILLYAARKPFFVIDAYTRRIFSRHGLIDANAPYDQLQRFFMSGLPRRVKLYNEYHALIVRAGKELCKKRPLCGQCPLSAITGNSRWRPPYDH